MTDAPDAPEKIWLDEPEDGAWWALQEPIGLDNTEYVRADLAQAMVSDAREKALREAVKIALEYNRKDVERFKKTYPDRPLKNTADSLNIAGDVLALINKDKADG